MTHHWHIFDQVLVRPELARRFDPNGVKILTEVGGHSLIRARGRPDGAGGSDHLPVIFDLEF
jgi:hypothetical protein